MARPVKITEPTKPFTVRIPTELHRKLKVHAFENGLTMNDYIIRLIQQDIKKLKGENS